MTINPPISPNSDRDALLDSQARYLETYRKALEQELGKLTNQAVDRWLKDSDRAFKHAVKDAVDTLSLEISTELESLISGTSQASIGLSSGASATGNISNRLANSLARLATNAALDAIGGGDQTSVTQNESERSRQAEATFRQSRSQQQAAAARHSARGERNL